MRFSFISLSETVTIISTITMTILILSCACYQYHLSPYSVSSVDCSTKYKILFTSVQSSLPWCLILISVGKERLYSTWVCLKLALDFMHSSSRLLVGAQPVTGSLFHVISYTIPSVISVDVNYN